jgi:hypothetical protein
MKTVNRKKELNCSFKQPFSFKQPLVFCLLVAGLTISPPGSAAKELTVYTGYRTGEQFTDEISGQTLDLKEGESYGVILNVPASKETEMEFLYSTQATKLSAFGSSVNGLSIDIEYWHLGGTYLFPQEKYTSYLAATFGATHMKPKQLSSETKFSFSLGGGAKIPLGEKLALRFEGRAFMTTLDSGGALFCSNGGCRITAKSSLLTQMEASAGITLKF